MNGPRRCFLVGAALVVRVPAPCAPSPAGLRPRPLVAGDLLWVETGENEALLLARAAQ